MQQVKNEINSLLENIELTQRQINLLLDEEFQQNQEFRQLTYKLQRLEKSTINQNKAKVELKEHHARNMKYLNDKIENHQNTFEKYKTLYQSLNNGGSHHDVSSSNMRQENYNFSNILSIKESNLNQSARTSKTILSKGHSGKFKQNQSLTVVTEIECQTCGSIFKPYSYYQHIPNCCPKKIHYTQLSASLLLD